MAIFQLKFFPVLINHFKRCVAVKKKSGTNVQGCYSAHSIRLHEKPHDIRCKLLVNDIFLPTAFPYFEPLKEKPPVIVLHDHRTLSQPVLILNRKFAEDIANANERLKLLIGKRQRALSVKSH